MSYNREIGRRSDAIDEQPRSSAEYEPLTRGMQAALRHVDDFLPAHNLVSLEQLADHLRALPARTRPVACRARHRSVSWN
jgi:hypothetical protein